MNDIYILRSLASRYIEICNKPVQNERRDLWRKHNSLKRTRPLIYVRGWPANEVPEMQALKCEDPFYRAHEYNLRWMLYQDTIGDDYILEPWLVQQASYITHPDGIWGVPFNRIPSPEGSRGSWMFDPPIKELDDINKLVKPRHLIDEEATERNVSKLHDAVGDIIDIAVDRSPAWFMWNADISTNLAYLRGLEQIMWDMIDNSGWLHRLLAFMRDGILAAHEEAEAAGDWSLANHQNQAMSYAEELPDPASTGAVTRDKLWTFCAAQELTLVSPQMHDEFMLQYQIPIMEKFGLTAYGCCEDLSEKIDILRKIPNLRRIAVAPRANVEQCAEQIGKDYVFSYRPNPADMVCCGFDPDHVRTGIKRDLEAAKGCHIDITLKDIQTVENQPERLREWVRVVREVLDNM